MHSFLTDFNGLCAKSEGRDKLGRFCQYASRVLVGLVELRGPAAGPSLLSLQTKAKSVMSQLGGARRTHRFCKEFPVAMAIPASVASHELRPVDLLLELLQKVAMIIYMLMDHWGCLKQWRVLPVGKRNGATTLRMAMKFFFFSNAVGLLQEVKKLRELGAASREEREEKAEERRKCHRSALRCFLLLVQTAHLSMLWQSHDVVVGLAGMITSALDVKGQWPRAQVRRAVVDKAKEA